ncbi:phosphopantothenoylcysteine decarboxylase-like protein [Tanacetum coccineum]
MVPDCADVRPVATQAALHFIDKISLAKDFIFNTYEVEWSPWSKIGDTVIHIELCWWANIIVIAPFSAKPLARCKVGSTCMSSSEALKAGIRGKALKICHHYRDALPLAPATPAAARNAISQRPNIPACKKYEIRHYYGSSSAGYSHRNGTYS